MKTNKRIKNNKKGNKRRYYNKLTTKGNRIYSYTIRTAIVNYITPVYTEQNLKFDIYDLLRSTEVFQSLQKQYLQYKLKKVMFLATPRQVNGTDPAPVWIYQDTSGINVFNYNALSELQGSKPLPVKHFSITSYSKSGRQNDYHYWYDVQTQASDLAIRLHSEASPNESKFWQFQIAFQVDFKGLMLSESPNTKGIIQEKVIKSIESESSNNIVQGPAEVKAEEQVVKEENEEDEAWNHVDSDWEE